jgi:hypothetical protein
MNSKILLALKSPGNWMLVIATGLGFVQQIRPCLTGKAAVAADSVLALVGALGVVWNTMHINEALKTVPPSDSPTQL